MMCLQPSLQQARKTTTSGFCAASNPTQMALSPNLIEALTDNEENIRVVAIRGARRCPKGTANTEREIEIEGYE